MIMFVTINNKRKNNKLNKKNKKAARKVKSQK